MQEAAAPPPEQAPPPPPPEPVAPPPQEEDKYAKLKEAKELLDAGVLTEEEFAEEVAERVAKQGLDTTVPAHLVNARGTQPGGR